MPHKNRIFKILLLLTTWSTLSCSKNSSSDYQINQNAQGDTIYQFKNPAAASESAKAFKLHCKNAPCPENVGSLISHLNDTELMLCTFSLIANNIALTNRHCLPDSIKRAGADCNGILEFALLAPGSKNSSVIYQCDSVISIPEEYNEALKDHQQRDFAVLKMLKEPRATASLSARAVPLQPSQSGIHNGDVLHVISTDPNPNTLGADFKEQDCTAVINPFVNSTFLDIHDPVASFKNCNIIHGNSGSPAIDTDQKLKAVIFSSLVRVPTQAGATDNSFVRRNQKAQAILNRSQIAFATNFTCIEVPELGLKLWSPQDCQTKPDRNSIPDAALLENPSFKDPRTAKLKAKLQQINSQTDIFQWNFDQPKRSDWSEEMSSHILVQELAPVCFNGVYDHFSWKPQFAADGLATLTVPNLPVEIVNPDIDDQLNTFITEVEKTQNVKIKFNYQNLLQSETHSTQVSVERIGIQLSKNKIETYEVGFCMHYVK